MLAELASIALSVLPPVVPPAVPADPLTLIETVSLHEIAFQQHLAVRSFSVGETAIDALFGVGPEANPWLWLGQQGRSVWLPLTRLDTGVHVSFPQGKYYVSAKRGTIEIILDSGPQKASATVSESGLLAYLYEKAVHLHLVPISYAALYQKGESIPESIALVRRDQDGIYWMTYAPLSALHEIFWLASVDGKMIGMKIIGDYLAFYSK